MARRPPSVPPTKAAVMPEYLAVPLPLFQAIGAFLQSQPYGQVRDLMLALESCEAVTTPAEE